MTSKVTKLQDLYLIGLGKLSAPTRPRRFTITFRRRRRNPVTENRTFTVMKKARILTLTVRGCFVSILEALVFRSLKDKIYRVEIEFLNIRVLFKYLTQKT
jgi:hypothetical protein